MALPEILTKNVRLPVMAAPMFIASTPELVIAQCKAGIIGSIPALNARPQSQLEDWIIKIQTELAEYDRQNPDQPAAPFAINQISHPSNDRLMGDLEIIAKYKIPIVIVSLYVAPQICEVVHSYGGIVLNDIISNRQAKKSVEGGVDGLIAVAAGAGGHTGNISPFALVSEIREWWDGPLALSGCIATGQNILAALATGADFAYIGSPFIATKEANAVADYKAMIVDGSAKDIITTDAFSGVPANFLVGSVERAGLDPKSLKRDADKAIDVSETSQSFNTWKDIWGCGQGINAVKNIVPTAELVARLSREYEAARRTFLDRIG
ncbi:2-nitropropane dioxygenase [gamma proteobacterium BDW918]|uniref:2-nitropropane dioxygenase n=1 Tax=Zhongshania aliphaticivorans TaxID=1470434 RepID=A0A127M2Q3_9GAMM|nr:nitronate monooxygenase family protein [Zhongshania aliphaticivorans]AMO67513.1 2-nitropropane dioxygenase [Zhongshania aliphaticivorans]EIF45139.1 2-nitropropane dioxygenase [gamma proteobacterium BDW918]